VCSCPSRSRPNLDLRRPASTIGAIWPREHLCEDERVTDRLDHREALLGIDASMRKSNQAFMERLLFGSPLMYRIKRFIIEEVIWKWILSGLFRLAPNPMPDVTHVIEGKRVLLAACGPGNVTTGPACDTAGEIVAFDISKDFASAAKTHHPEWKTFCGDIVAIPIFDNAFDLAVICSALHHIPAHASRVLTELARVTDGRVLIVEGTLPERGLLRRALRVWWAIVDGGVHYYTRTELLSVFDELGMEVEIAGQHGPIRHMMLTVLKTRPA